MTPTLHSPFPGKLNPYVASVDSHTSQWLTEYGLIRTEEDQRHNRDGKFTYMVARMFPNASPELLAIASDLNALLFLMDDRFDSQGTLEKKPQFEGLVHRMEAIMKNECHQRLDNPLLDAWADIWKRLRTVSSEEWQKRFCTALQSALQANLWRMGLVDAHRLPTVAEYLEKRAAIGGANFFVYLLEIMEAFELPEQIFTTVEVMRLLDFCSETICLANDIFSFRKELLEDDHMNLVMLLKQEKNIPLEAAVQLACYRHDDEVRAFEWQRSHLPSFGDRMNAMLEQFTEGLGIMMRGNIDWSVKDSQRYMAHC